MYLYHFIRTDASHPHFIELTRLLDQELAIIDGEEHDFYHQFNSIQAIKYALVWYNAAQKPVACGAIKALESNNMEVKRMYVLPDYRNKGVASQVLSQLEIWASELGFDECVLETGIRQVDAVRLYEKNGYTRIPNYGQYIGIENSVCFKKQVRPAQVMAVSKSPQHTMRKPNVDSIVLLTGLGIEGDAHCGTTVKHRSRVAQNPDQPNLRQVHLIHAELHHELAAAGFSIEAGQMGENITTQGIDLLGLPRHTRLYIGPEAILEVTGLRNPCNQLNGIQPGLMNAVLDHDAAGNLIRKAGIMTIVLQGGTVGPGDKIRMEYPEMPFLEMERV